MFPTSERAEDVASSDSGSLEKSIRSTSDADPIDDIISSLLDEFEPDRGGEPDLDREPDLDGEPHLDGEPTPSPADMEPATPEHRHHRRLLKLAACVLALLMTVAGWSYVKSVTAPGKTDTIAIRSVEWLREVHMGWLVNSVERWWYTSFGKPEEGGNPERDIAIVGANPDRSESETDNSSEPSGGNTDNAPPHLPPPATMITPAPEPMPGEGEWQPVGPTIGGIPGMYATQIRPDATHTSILGLAVWMDPKLVRFQLHPGSNEPGGTWQTPPMVPQDQQADLMAAFNSGFKLNESQGGFFTEGREAIPLRDGQATMVIRDDGTMEVGQWGRDFQMGPDVVSARQNLALIVDDGAPVPGLESDAGGKWGNTLGGDVLVWRSGVGQTADGAIVYVTSDALTAASLADLLIRAGAVRAMELDINHAWTQFNIYSTDETGAIKGTKGLPDMMKSGDRYLTTESRDFVSVFARKP